MSETAPRKSKKARERERRARAQSLFTLRQVVEDFDEQKDKIRRGQRRHVTADPSLTGAVIVQKPSDLI